MKREEYNTDSNILIHKAGTEFPYTIVPNSAVQDQHLSLSAKGMLAFLLSLPQHWKVHRAWVLGNCAEGRRRTDQALQELRQAGYIQCEQQVNHDGHFQPMIYRVFPTPDGAHQSTISPRYRNTASGNAVKTAKNGHKGSTGAGCSGIYPCTDRDTASGNAVHLLENKHSLETKQSFRAENDRAQKKQNPEIHYQSIVGQYNEICGAAGCHLALKLTDKRKAAIRRRWQDSPELQSIDGWSTYFTIISTHPNLAWLRGHNDRGWRADIDYITSERGILKIYEQSQSAEVNKNEYSAGRFQPERESFAEQSNRQIREYLAKEGISADYFAEYCDLETAH